MAIDVMALGEAKAPGESSRDDPLGAPFCAFLSQRGSDLREREPSASQ